MARFRHVFLIGVGHSGSNLLSRLLARHPAVACVGETAWAGRAMEAATPCTCGASYGDCPFWGPQLEALEGGHGYDYRRYTPELFEALRRASGRRVLVDNSKTRVWRMARHWPEAGFLFLVRDSRGVLASGLRKGGELGHILRRHRKWIRRWGRFARRRADRTLVLRYEDLCSDLEAELRRVVEFLGLDFDPALLGATLGEHHFMYSAKTGALDRGTEVRRDDRWRDELSSEAAERIRRSMERVPFYRELYAS